MPHPYLDLDRDLERDIDLERRLTGDDEGDADIDLEAAAAFFLGASPTPGLDERLRLLWKDIDLQKRYIL